jgi:beta-glucanase (GH16 family)
VKLTPLVLAIALFVPRAPAIPTPRTLFLEDFSGPDLDRSRWTVIVTGRTVNNEQQAYVDSPDVLTIRHGALVVQPRYREGFRTPQGNAFDFVSGRIETRGTFAFTYGTAAARMKLSAGAGLWPAFWALGDGRWPDTGEIDIMENVGERRWTSVALHGPGYFGDTPLVARAPVDVTRWHVYSVDWTEHALIFRIDGREVYRATRDMVERHGRWAFDNPKHLILNLALGGNYPFAVNKTDAPYRGLPESTVRAIQRNDAKVLVDWVRVSR